MSRSYIVFVNSANDWPLLSEVYSNAAGCRVSLQSVIKKGAVPTGVKVWIDLGVDGLDNADVATPEHKINPEYKNYIQQFSNYQYIADPAFQEKPETVKVEKFVASILGKAIEKAPNASWFSVPQLPYSKGSNRNKINRLLAESTQRWKPASFRGKLMLPVIFPEPNETNAKKERDSKVKLAVACRDASNASGLWVVDATLDDQSGAASLETERFRGLIKFHEELNSALPSEVFKVAGPYWALNLVLWARGLVRLPAIGIAQSYQYRISGGMQKSAVTRIAIPPLKRLAVWSPGLKTWLEQTLQALDRNDPARGEFLEILRHFQSLKTREHARRQIAGFYTEWLSRLEAAPSNGRALALYQDFSAAFVLGKGLKKPLPPLPPSEKGTKNPSRIAQQFMVNCL